MLFIYSLLWIALFNTTLVLIWVWYCCVMKCKSIHILRTSVYCYTIKFGLLIYNEPIHQNTIPTPTLSKNLGAQREPNTECTNVRHIHNYRYEFCLTFVHCVSRSLCAHNTTANTTTSSTLFSRLQPKHNKTFFCWKFFKKIFSTTLGYPLVGSSNTKSLWASIKAFKILFKRKDSNKTCR